MAENISISLPERSTKAYRVHIGNHVFYFSYRTCIAYNGPSGLLRRHNDWGPTTGRHFSDLQCAHYPEVSGKDFETFLNGVMVSLDKDAATILGNAE